MNKKENTLTFVFDGKVLEIGPDTSKIIITEKETKISEQTFVKTEELKEHKIFRKGARFNISYTIQKNGKPYMQIKPIKTTNKK